MKETAPPTVVAALREKQGQLRALLARQHMAVKEAQMLLQGRAEAAEQTRISLDELAAYLASIGAEQIESAPPAEEQEEDGAQLDEDGAVILGGVLMREEVTNEAVRLLKQYRFVRTERVVESLTARKVKLNVAHPVVRVSQILSADSRFGNRRGLGWYYKGESPVAAGLSDATESSEGQTTSGS